MLGLVGCHWRYLGRLALFKGEASEEVIKAKVTIAEATSRPTKKISCLPDSFRVRSHVRYCTVTSVPTGISEKNLRAVSSGNRMQPCDAGKFGT